jgi:hypothetical protein
MATTVSRNLQVRILTESDRQSPRACHAKPLEINLTAAVGRCRDTVIGSSCVQDKAISEPTVGCIIGTKIQAIYDHHDSVLSGPMLRHVQPRKRSAAFRWNSGACLGFPRIVRAFLTVPT